ncbi:MAG: hypothetical protein RL018_1720 [Pseudomonadota bacterium]|jgi:hypothetical protein
MSSILIGVLQPGAREFGVGITKPRRGVAMFNGVARGVIVKSSQGIELAAECFCTLLLNSLGVKSPPCGVVFDNQIPHFASIDLANPNLIQQFCIDSNNPAQAEIIAIAEELAQWIGFGRLIALDVLIRNGDRHPGNLLTDGSDYWAIDHGRALDIYPYEMHKSFRIVQEHTNALTCANLEASAISHALTIPLDCSTLAERELQAHSLIARFAKPFADMITTRQPTLASSLKGLL